MQTQTITSIEHLKQQVGREIGISDWFTVDQARINAFAQITCDDQWIHTDPERAKAESPYQATIAHGFLTLSLISHLLHRAVRIDGGFRHAINYGLNRVRFTGPVIAGSRIRGHFVLRSLEECEGGWQTTYAVTVEREGAEKPVLVAEWITRLYNQ